MLTRSPGRRSRFVALAVAATLKLCIAQTSPSPAFDVASVKPSVSTNYWYTVSPMKNAHGRLVATNITLKQLLEVSYGVPSLTIIGGPKWVDSDRFDVDAKGDLTASDNDLAPMLQSLLIDRFHLRVHTETKQTSVLALVVAHDPPKLEPSRSDCGPNGKACKGVQYAGDGLTAEHVTMTALARALAGIIGSQVLDETGLKDAYDFKLQFVDRAEAAPGSAVAGIFSALQQQLGLKLEARKVPMKMLVIDGAEKPGGN